MRKRNECDTIWSNARVLLPSHDTAHTIAADGVVAAKDGLIVYAGPRSGVPELAAGQTLDCGGRLLTPGLIDCHTHLVFAGSRATEWQARLDGQSYEDIARSGGGILSTVRATRAASAEQLLEESRRRLTAMIADGVTTVEIKSGYGLDLETERRMLQTARSLSEVCQATVRTTFLGAHALPTEFVGDGDRYIDLVTGEMLPTLAAEGLVDAVDAFCEGIGFTPQQTARVFEAARRHKLPVKLHAEQLSNLAGAALAARYGALSADHLEHLDQKGIAAMSKSGTVATLLPGAFYFTRERNLPPVAGLRKAGVPMAVATDCNPGTSPLTSILLAMNMAATLFGLTVDECLTATTRHAARALGLTNVGALLPGFVADIAVWDVAEPAELVYRMGGSPLHARYWRGR